MYDVDVRDRKRSQSRKLESIARRKRKADKRHGSGELNIDRILADLNRDRYNA